MIHILIIEDEISMLKGLQDNLEFEGYKVDTADRCMPTPLKLGWAGSIMWIAFTIWMPKSS